MWTKDFVLLLHTMLFNIVIHSFTNHCHGFDDSVVFVITFIYPMSFFKSFYKLFLFFFINCMVFYELENVNVYLNSTFQFKMQLHYAMQ